MASAAETVILSKKTPRTKQEAGQAIGSRNSALVNAANAALVVWNGADPQIGALVKALEKRIPDDVWIISPD